MSKTFKRIRVVESSDEEEYRTEKSSTNNSNNKSKGKDIRRKKIQQKTLELFGSDEEGEKKYRHHYMLKKGTQSFKPQNVSDCESLLLENIQSALSWYEVEIHMYSKLTPQVENLLKHMSFLLKLTCKHYKRTEETKKDYIAFKNSLNTPGVAKSVEEISSAKSEFESERQEFINKLIERGGKFLSALKEVMKIFNQSKKALTLAFVEVLKESVEGDISRLTAEYIDECRSMCEKMLVQNRFLEFGVFFTRMKPEYFHKLIQRAIGLSQSRLVGSMTPSSTTSGKHEHDFCPYGKQAIHHKQKHLAKDVPINLGLNTFNLLSI